MRKHDHHNHCSHNNLAYCPICDVVYCRDCGKEWGKRFYGYRWVYPYWEPTTVSTSWGGTADDDQTITVHAHN